MTILNDENFSLVFADKDDQTKIRRERSKTYWERKVRKAEFASPDVGWRILDDSLQRDVKLAKDKPTDQRYEDELWVLLSRLSFNHLSRDRSCRIQYDEKDGAAQQVDVLAVDDECAVIIECKCAEVAGTKPGDFKTEIESLGAKKAGLHRELRARFNKPKLKIAYVLATRNYILRQADVDRLATFGILEYYTELVAHLGSAARYQFQADLFQGQDIPEMESRIYAVQASMGGIEYYSFCIEPERLLKMGYVLHRSKSIKTLPSYQRLIKKKRLQSIKKFINNGGYFPNSLIVSVDNESKKARFEPFASPIPNASSRAGILHLPPQYRSLYVIDGQHRLYGYSDSEYADNNSVPVVAFMELPREEQLRLFMEINENQKAVSKNLKHTLDADLKWDSKNLAERAEGIKKQLAQELGENVTSPLFNRVLVGEDQRTEIRVLTLEAILRGLNQTKFVGKFTKDAVREQGMFNTGDSTSTVEKLRRLLSAFFTYIATEYESEWTRLPKDGGLLTINDGVTSLIMVFGDVLEHLERTSQIKPLAEGSDSIIEKAATYLDGLKPYFRKLTEPDRAELRKKYGSGAPTRLRRIFQKAIHEAREDFSPIGLKEYWRDQSKLYNIETYSRVADIELKLRDDIKQLLMQEHGTMWLKKGLPEKLFTHLSTEAAKKNRLIENDEDEKTPWDCLNLIHIRDIVMHGAQWSTLFQKNYTIPGQEAKKKEDKTSWLAKLNSIRNNADHEYSVSKDEADYVAAIHDWLILGDHTDISSRSSIGESNVENDA
ncbi:DGQHR domain-containing protein [Aminobacter sp. AP02]|uniref:DGQHR domain-containing protein n=1 Tax=Aminobacter sp. AP02 TaxID=2135737 RepID=UPI000D6D694E|nr:DGQHR domain-containing protein [Aminobacter sp. AP02]PWK70526.1 DNA sulfur modification protein DndB [Aminobacter sp. AP02]